MKKSTIMLFMMITFISVLMVINSNNWINMWMSLEINMMAFIPLISKNKNHLTSESIMMYFLAQSMGSMIMLCIILLNYPIMMTNYMIEDVINSMLCMSMAIKLGVPPFHFWFPDMLSKIDWIKCLLMMTWQKVAPLFIMSCINMTQIMMMLVILSAIVGGIGGLNQTSMRKLMAYSSINHMSWMMSCLFVNKNLWMVYISAYTIMMLPLIMWMHANKLYFINQISMITKTFLEKITLSMVMLSIGGLPPFIGFFLKWMIIKEIMLMDMKIMIIIMIMSSLLTLFYYMRIMSCMYLINNSVNKWMMKYYMNNSTIMYMFVINFMLPPTLYLIL